MKHFCVIYTVSYPEYVSQKYFFCYALNAEQAEGIFLRHTGAKRSDIVIMHVIDGGENGTVK